MSEDEIKCDACGGTGVHVVKHPSKPSKQIITRCKVCNGKGRVKKAAD